MKNLRSKNFCSWGEMKCVIFSQNKAYKICCFTAILLHLQSITRMPAQSGMAKARHIESGRV